MWVSFADIIYTPSDKCHMLENVEIDKYKLYILKYAGWAGEWNRHIYEPKEKECVKCRWFFSSEDKIFLLDKNIVINGTTAIDDIMNKALFMENSNLRILEAGCNTSSYNKVNVYKIINNGDSYEIVLNHTKQLKRKSTASLLKFLFALFTTIIIETITLFIIAKIFRKENLISNKKLFLYWIVPSIVTLPFLWFIVPFFLGDGIKYLVIWELLVSLLEAIILKYWLKISRKRAILASVICNLCSYLIGILISYAESYNFKMDMILWLSFVFIEATILFFIGKSSRDWIPKDRIILCCFLVPILEIILGILFKAFIIQVSEPFSDLLIFLVAIITKVLIDIIIVKYLRKISFKKAVITSIFSNLYFIAIILVIVYLLWLIN